MTPFNEEPGIKRYYSMPAEEQETTITFTRSDKCCYVWTSDKTMITKLDKLCVTSPDNYKLENTGLIDGLIADKEYIITDKSLLSFRSSKVKRELTEEQRQKYSERMKNLQRKSKS